MRRFARLLLVVSLLAPAVAAGQQATSVDTVIDRFIAKEVDFLNRMQSYTPIVETYLQEMRPDQELGAVPNADRYYLGRLSLSRGLQHILFQDDKKGGLSRGFGKLTPLYRMQFDPLGFAQMVLIDAARFDRIHYDFRFVRREFLGEVRCLVFDVQPRKGAGKGTFLGRIWVEDLDYNIVRFDGTYQNGPAFGHYFHFDSWRVEMQRGVWLPSYVYVEESDLKIGLGRRARFKAQTRLWGYDSARLQNSGELTKVLIEAPSPVKDQSETARDLSPVHGLRAWEQQAQGNLIERLERAGLLAPEGEVTKILETVANNLQVTNNLDIQPEVKCRVLLTMPIESFTLGHTIVISRGLLDVLPDEASLASVLAHELAHIVLGHRIDTKYAFSDRMLFEDEMTFRAINIQRTPTEEQEADQKALELMTASPYKDKLAGPGLFLAQLRQRAPALPSLLRGHFGNPYVNHGNQPIMTGLLQQAPALEPKNVSQIAALPLGGRIKLDAWASTVQIVKSGPVSHLSAREKMPFELAPLFPYLTRQVEPSGADVAQK